MPPTYRKWSMDSWDTIIVLTIVMIKKPLILACTIWNIPLIFKKSNLLMTKLLWWITRLIRRMWRISRIKVILIGMCMANSTTATPTSKTPKPPDSKQPHKDTRHSKVAILANSQNWNNFKSIIAIRLPWRHFIHSRIPPRYNSKYFKIKAIWVRIWKGSLKPMGNRQQLTEKPIQTLVIISKIYSINKMNFSIMWTFQILTSTWRKTTIIKLLSFRQ